MHSHRFIHQDLKPSNILLNADGQTLIADFGTSRCKANDHTPTHDTGTPHYAAPELFEDDARTKKVDVFSFGLICYEILVGRAVFRNPCFLQKSFDGINRGNDQQSRILFVQQ
jgi:serine/threonine protein kinase